MSAIEDFVNQLLASQTPDWSTVSLRDVSWCITSKIGYYQALRGYRNQTEGLRKTLAVADDLKKLFQISAQKRGERGVADLKKAINELEEKSAKRVNPFDGPRLDALKAEYARLTQRNA
jgi:hypothetical protein